MRAELFQRMADLTRRDEPFVVAFVVSRSAPSSAQRGDMAVVTADGAFEGWLGGACTQPTVVAEARSALADGKPRLVALAPEPAAVERPGVVVFPMTCHSGGSVEIYLEPVVPPARLVLFGRSPVTAALARLGLAAGYAVTAVGAGSLALPEEVDRRAEIRAGDLPAGAVRPLYALVAAAGEGDEEAIQAALCLDPVYLGVVSSRRRFQTMRETLRERGVPTSALDGIRSPAGLDIGAETPEEIALSVLAQIVSERRASVALPVEVERAAAVDPVCGMTVEVEGARHLVRHGGATVYFCGAGCRERFLADPGRYAASRAGAA